MKLYFEIAKFYFLKIAMYPWDAAAFIAGRLISIGFLILFWNAVSKSSAGVFDFRQLTAYFLITGAIKDLTFSTSFRFGSSVQNKIKSGEISNYIIKPVRTLPFLFSAYTGDNGSLMMYSILAFLSGIIIFPPKSFLNLAGFFVFFFIALLISMGLNIYVAVLSFYSPEAKNIKNMAAHIARILSGALVPLIYFPPVFQKIIFLTPFPSLAFTPAFVLQNEIVWGDIIKTFFISAFWAVTILISANYFWKKSIRNYEGVGI